jgi:hypothetical protein
MRVSVIANPDDDNLIDGKVEVHTYTTSVPLTAPLDTGESEKQ